MYLVFNQDKPYLLKTDILLMFDEFCRNTKKSKEFIERSSVAKFIHKIPELMVTEDIMLIVHRHAIAKYRIYKLNPDCSHMEELEVTSYLDSKDIYIDGESARRNRPPLVIDFKPFYDYSPSMRDSRNIGNGIRFLNKHLSSSLFQAPDKWENHLYEFLKIHKISGKQLLINGDILYTRELLIKELERVLEWLTRLSTDVPYESIAKKLKRAGFEGGWGKNAERIVETMQLLHDLFHEPNSPTIEAFIARIPMISKIAVVSPHGWFGQENVLGKPDTGGQVIYILDQVKAMETYLTHEFETAGIDTTPKIIVLTRLIPNSKDTSCDMGFEKIDQTNDCWILRVPFKDKKHRIVPDWISRFHIWPYLDRFAYDSKNALISEFEGRPDLIIGNYSDGNLVASLLSDRLDVIQCTIAHALEKTKYLFSDLYWKQMEPDYNFSLQFTADMISMNKSDFIITSTYQEIAGTEASMGQYESYQFFTMPGLYQVKNGVNLFNPKFNIVPPGVNEDIYFPYDDYEKRISKKSDDWNHRLFYDTENEDIYGCLNDPEKPPIFTMARFDRIKNITGLIQAFGEHSELNHACNLIFAAGTIHPDRSGDLEEREEIEKAYRLIDELNLHGRVRWLPSIDKKDTGEVYRIFADRKGVFVQPALFEAFGLTILEAMLSGLPTFGPEFGGPSEIIRDGVSGFLMNTSRPELISEAIWKFIQKHQNEPAYWNTISENGIQRVREKFTWKLYNRKLMSLAKSYGFWRYAAAGRGMVKLDRYCDLLYHLLLKQRAEQLY